MATSKIVEVDVHHPRDRLDERGQTMSATSRAERLCPDCHVVLVPCDFHGLILDVCSQCAGIWFDGSEFDRLSSMESGALAALDAEVRPSAEVVAKPAVERWCPVCPGPLDRVRFATNSPIEIDTCPSCRGTWIGDGDLDRIQAWVSLQRLPRFTQVQRSADDIAMEMAQCALEHEAVMERAHALTSFFKALGRHKYQYPLGW